jgi:hypothetical protein
MNILDMDDEQIWNLGGMTVRDFLENSPSHQSIREICEDVPCDCGGYTEEESKYITESLIRTIINEPISSFIIFKVKLQRRRNIHV